MARKTGSNGKQTAKAIRAKSLELFASHGYAAVSMRQIAQAVGIQASGIYLYYPTKQQLLCDIMQRHMDELLAAWLDSGCPLAPRAALEHFTRFHIRHHIKRADAVFVSYMELRSLEAEEFPIIEKLRRRYEALLVDILERGKQAGEFDIREPHVSAMAILSMITGVNTWFRSGGRLSQSVITDLYVEMTLSLVGLPMSNNPRFPCR